MGISVKEQKELRRRGNHLLDSANKSYSRNNIEQTLGFVEKASEILPKDSRISSFLMEIYSDLQAKGENEKAADVAKKMLELDCFNEEMVSRKASKKNTRIKIVVLGSIAFLLLSLFLFGISRFIFVFQELSKLDI